MIRDIPKNWRDAIARHVERDEWRNAITSINNFLEDEENYYPIGENIFDALYKVDFNNVRVVIIGQDPYPNEADATGVAFSTPINRGMAKSVAMIYCAIATDLAGRIPMHGNLDHWTRQGVLLLNCVLTYRLKIQPIDPRTELPYTKKENLHKIKKNEIFTRTVLKALSNDRSRRLHFMLWGKDAEKLETYIDGDHHNILSNVPHPAIIEAEKFEEFRKCGHFSTVNNALGARRINWFPPPPENP